MGSPLSTVPPWYSVEDDWTPPPFLCSPGEHVIPPKIFWRPHSQVISNDWFPKRRSCSAATIRERGSGSERNCYAWQQLPYNRPTAHLSLTTNATWLNSITTKLTNRFAWARPKKLNLKLTLCFTLMMAFAQVISHKVTDNIPLQKIGRSLKLYDRLFLTTSKHFLQIFWYHNF